jgi:hypothetical protein
MRKNRVTIVRAFASGQVSSIDLVVLRGLVNCLEPREVCEVFDAGMEQPYRQRRILLQKMVADMADCQHCHVALADNLLLRWESLSYPKKQRCAFVLNSLYDLLPVELQEKILRLFLRSRCEAVRKRGYALLRKSPGSPLRKTVLSSWDQFHDDQAAGAVIEFASPSQLKKRFHELDACVARTWLQNKLYVRMAQIDPSFLGAFEDRDGIAFAYACAKVCRPMLEKTAKRLYRQYANDKRVGLLIWCFGQLRLWDVLLSIAEGSRETFGELSHGKLCHS